MIVSPFLGEFGWEVALWAPHLRWLRRRHYRNGDFKVWCRPGHEILYADFASEVCPAEVRVRRVDCQNAWNVLGLIDPYMLVNKLEGKQTARKKVIHPGQMEVLWDPVPFTKKTAFIQHGVEDMKVHKLIGIHARLCVEKQPERNMDLEMLQDLVDRLTLRGHCIWYFGRTDQATSLSPVHDHRGRPLGEVVELMAECQVVIGPSSGPLHLANQCGTPVVWWSGNAKDVPRYESVWNPFGCRNVQAAASWDPGVEEILDAVASITT